jgi:stage III sporulation protein AF
MAWINGWIKELILIILLASFTDLLLPSHALQRYVRTVIGLFLLLVLLSPIYELFHHRWTPNQWMQAALGSPAASDIEMLSFPEIVKDSNELKAANEKQAKQLLEKQLAVSMQEGIDSQIMASVEKLQVSIRLDGNGKPSIDQVNVVLGQDKVTQKASDAPESSEEPFIAVIKPITPVIIDLKSDPAESAKQLEPANKQPSTLLQEQVKQYIAQQWQLKSSQIQVN